jgi:hypothetical protein
MMHSEHTSYKAVEVAHPTRNVVAWFVALTMVGSLAEIQADTRPKQSRLVPGGIDVAPQLTTVVSNQLMILSWVGFGGPYQVETATALGAGSWTKVGEPTDNLSLTMAMLGQTGFFQVISPDPQYVGAATCRTCHRGAHTDWSETVHARALKSLEDIKQDRNSVCLPCHTVGYGFATGFKDKATTPHLANVQCENCHGPGGAHAANPDDASVRPVVELSGMMCGGCHTDAHHPTYDEWAESRHSTMDVHVAESIEQLGTARMLACGPCHSGSTRIALLNQVSNPSVPLPTPHEAAETAITCAVCHHPHKHYGGVNAQLRNPTYSTNNFSYNTSTNTSFAKQYDPKIQLCGQCHNMRGATWQTSSRPPHHSPQYNILIGQGGYDLGNPRIAAHGRDIQKQCAHCHTHAHEVNSPSEEEPNYTGHIFEPTQDGCVDCHDAESLDVMTEATQKSVKDRVTNVKNLLDQWGLTKAPEVLRNKYGARAWEYTAAGQLTNPNAVPSLNGPTAAEQSEIPDVIKQARYNLYLIEHDHSYGLHNPRYSRFLLDVAKTNVNTLLKP